MVNAAKLGTGRVAGDWPAGPSGQEAGSLDLSATQGAEGREYAANPDRTAMVQESCGFSWIFGLVSEASGDCG